LSAENKSLILEPRIAFLTSRFVFGLINQQRQQQLLLYLLSVTNSFHAVKKKSDIIVVPMEISRGRLLLAILLLAATVGLITAGWLSYLAFTPRLPGSKDPIVVEIYRGQSPFEISKSLYEKGAINDPEFFLWLGRLSKQWKKVKAGEYLVSAGMTPLGILSVISSGISINHPLTVREGENIYEIANELQSRGLGTRAGFLALCKDQAFISSLVAIGFRPPLPSTLEGYLFPDTYFLNRTLTPEEVIRQMIKRFISHWGESQKMQAQALRMTRHQVITLASIIEKETGAPHERALISSVFHNRMKKKMRLQSDPTTIYGIWARFKGNLKKEDLQAFSPYNTYVIPGLPVGPIANPGKEAIEAALNPVPSNHLFFVSHNDGTHEFTESFEKHVNAVRKFQKSHQARDGKSWRDLQKYGVSKTPK
jgi:UPF0755 protein